MFRLKGGGKKEDLTLLHEWIWDDVKEYYENQPNFDGWENFNDTWDIGTDDPTVLNNWDDPARSDTWWTWGISRFKIVKRIGLTYVINKEEGITKSFAGVMEYFVAQGYAKPSKGGYKIDVKKFLDDTETRECWNPLLETTFSLNDAHEWQQYYYKDDVIINEHRED